MSIKGDVLAQYLRRGDPALANYYPAWLDNMADDATVEGSLWAGRGSRPVNRGRHPLAVWPPGAQVRRPCGKKGFLEDYIAEVRGQPIGCVVLVTRNDAGKTQHVVASYRPRSSLLLLSRLLREKFAGTPYAEHFATRESWKGPMPIRSTTLPRRKTMKDRSTFRSGVATEKS
jgi:hypothetical protein